MLRRIGKIQPRSVAQKFNDAHIPQPPLVIICALCTSDRESRDPGRNAANCVPNIRRASSLSSSDVSEHFHKNGRSFFQALSPDLYFDLSYNSGCRPWNRPCRISAPSPCNINRKTSRRNGALSQREMKCRLCCKRKRSVDDLVGAGDGKSSRCSCKCKRRSADDVVGA